MALVLWNPNLNRNAIRKLLNQEGLSFCDDQSLSEEEKEEVRKGDQPTRFYQALTLEAVECSSHDLDQGPSNVLNVFEDGFWSSRGSKTMQSDEHITFRFREGLSVPRTVVIQVYEATYQHGNPMYPPSGVAFSVGWSPRNLIPVGRTYHFAAIRHSQKFILPAGLPPVTHIRVHFLGKRQLQREDWRYYHAIKHVAMEGYILSRKEQMQHLWQGSQCQNASDELTRSENFQDFLAGRPDRNIRGASPSESEGVKGSRPSEPRSLEWQVEKFSEPTWPSDDDDEDDDVQ